MLIYISLGFISLIAVLGVIWGIRDYVDNKKYLPLKSTTITGKQRDFVFNKALHLLRDLQEQHFRMFHKVYDLKKKGYSEEEAIELLEIDKVKDTMDSLESFKNKIAFGSKLTQEDIDGFNCITSKMRLTINIVDWTEFIPKKKQTG